MANVIILALLAAALVFGVKSYAGKLAHGCCGAGGDGAVKKVRVADRDASHYPYVIRLGVTGMTCSNCKRRVENALNGIDGVFAEVNLKKACAVVRMKTPVPEDALRRAVAQAGYGVSEYKTLAG